MIPALEPSEWIALVALGGTAAGVVVAVLALWYARRSYALASAVAGRDRPDVHLAVEFDGGVVALRLRNRGQRPTTVEGAGFGMTREDSAARLSARFKSVPPFTDLGWSVTGQPAFPLVLDVGASAVRTIDVVSLLRERGPGRAPRGAFADDAVHGRIWTAMPDTAVAYLDRVAGWPRVWEPDPRDEYGQEVPPDLAALPD